MDGDTDSRCSRSYTLRYNVRLLGIETHQRADNLLHHRNLVVVPENPSLSPLRKGHSRF